MERFWADLAFGAGFQQENQGRHVFTAATVFPGGLVPGTPRASGLIEAQTTGEMGDCW